MSLDQNEDTHEFVVTDVQLVDKQADDLVALILTDVRGGRVRLRLNGDMAEVLRERIAFALDKSTGP